MNIEEIEIFLTLVRTLSITKTSEILHLAQSTVSHRLKTLEEDIGFVLIDRKRGQKNIRLTQKGQEFISIAQRWNTLIQETHSLKTADPQLSLSIASVDSLNTTVLLPLYHKLISQSPKCKLKILTKASTEIYELVEKREIDLGFVLREISSSNIIIEPVLSEQMVVLGTTGNSSKAAIHPSDLDPRYEVFFNWSPTYMIWHNRWWDPLPSHQLEVDTISLIIATLMDNPSHWAIVPKSMFRSFPLAKNFIISELSDPPPNRVCYKIRHRFPYSDNSRKMELVNRCLNAIL